MRILQTEYSRWPVAAYAVLVLGAGLLGAARVGFEQQQAGNLPPGRVDDALVSYYSFQDGAGNVAVDLVGDLDLAFQGNVSWLASTNGVGLTTGAWLSTEPALGVHEALTAANASTFEIWARPDKSWQGGPARLLSYCGGLAECNVLFAQRQGGMQGRVRMSEGSNDAGWPYLDISEGGSTDPHHYAITFDGASLRIYLDGELRAEEERAGDLSYWDPAYPLILGATVDGVSGWSGELYQAAVYARALNPLEIERNHQVGFDISAGGATPINQAPIADAGDAQTIVAPALSIQLSGAALDDGLPASSDVTVAWEKVNGPGSVTFATPEAADTEVSFSAAGQYQLRLTASDGVLSGSDEVTVEVLSTDRVTDGLVALYPFTEGAGSIAGDHSSFGVPLPLSLGGQVEWLSGRSGVRVGPNGKLLSAVADKISSAAIGANAYSFEIWLSPSPDGQYPSARAFKLGSSLFEQNIVMLQQGSDWEIRARTTAGDGNGWPYLKASGIAAAAQSQYVVTSDGGNLSLYKDGALVKTEQRTGDLSNWDLNARFVIGNDIETPRPWKGDVYLAAVYARALSAEEVLRNYQVGSDLVNGGDPVPNAAPIVEAGHDRWISLPKNKLTLRGSVQDDGLPSGQLAVAWSVVDGPGAVSFSPPDAPNAIAVFSDPGLYRLRLTADDSDAPAVSDELLVDVLDARIARVLDHATWGPTPALMDRVRAIGVEAFIEEQLAIPPSGYAEPAGTWIFPVQSRFFHNGVHGEDQLRQRVAFALSKILAIKPNPVGAPARMTPFLRMLEENAFGNYYDILVAATLSPAMGEFLDMVNNVRQFPGRPGPNENYARELAQLFSLGVYELNPDGTRRRDTSGDLIPTYDEEFVSELSRVLTGWTYPPQPGNTSRFPNSPYYEGEMAAIGWVHDPDEKTLLNGFVIPAGMEPRAELEMALRHIFEHPNVGPFISRQLIQQLVTSNPSAAYVSRVSATFNNNGAGVKGDLAAVVKAILLDPEAGQSSAAGGHLEEPVLYAIGAMRSLNATVDPDLSALFAYTKLMGQDLFSPPSVFSYFRPNFRIQDGALFGPEFQILTGSTALERINFVNVVVWNAVAPGVSLDLSVYENLADDPELLADAIDERLFQGRMSGRLRQAILSTAEATVAADERARNTVYVAITSNEYQVQH